MAIVFALRGTSSTAFYAGGYATPHVIGTVTVDAGAGTGIIGNSIINLDQGSFAQRSLIYAARGSFPLTQKMSVLMRCAFGDTSNALQMYYMGGCGSDAGNQARASGAATIVSTASQKETGASLINNTYSFAYSTATYYDFVWTFDGTLTTNAYALYKDATSVATGNFSATRAAVVDMVGGMIALGTQNSNAQNQTRIKLNEFVIWDTIIDPTSGGLNLNGSSRSSFVTASAFEGLSYTDPGIATVQTGVSYTFAGSTLTGTYDGSDRWTDPGDNNVRASTAYKANSTTNNKTGRVTVPVASNVKSGVAFETDAGTTGTYASPSNLVSSD